MKTQRSSALLIISFLFLLSMPCFSADKKPEDILAETDDIKITRADFTRDFENFSQRANPQQVARISSEAGKKEFLGQMVEIKLLAKAAIKQGLNKGSKFEEDCKEATLGGLANEYVNKFIKKVQVTDEEINAFYTLNKKNFKEPTSYHFSQITVKTASDAAKIKAKLDAKKSFIELAKKSSIDSFKDAGGDRGFMSEDKISPALSPILKQLKKDENSAPVRTGKDAYTIVKLLETKEGKEKSLQDVSAEIKQTLTSNKQREAYEEAMDGIKKEIPMKIDEEAIQLLKNPEFKPEELSKTLITVGNKEIKLSEVAGSLSQIPAFLRPQVLQGKGLLDFVNQVAYRNMASAYAEKHYAELAKEFPEVLTEVENKFAIKALLDKELGNLQIPEKEVEDHYNKHLAEYKTSPKIRARHILVKKEKDAKEILNKLKKDIKQFKKLAEENSTCPSGKRGGGDLGMFDPAQMVPEFSQACEKAEIGKLVGPVKTNFGYHIIIVDEKTKGGHKKLEEVSDSIKAQLMGSKQKEAYMALILKLKKEYKVKIYQDKL